MIKELMHDPIFLACLGKMYACDEQFKKNIDKRGVETADIASKAIAICCKEVG